MPGPKTALGEWPSEPCPRVALCWGGEQGRWGSQGNGTPGGSAVGAEAGEAGGEREARASQEERTAWVAGGRLTEGGSA